MNHRGNIAASLGRKSAGRGSSQQTLNVRYLISSGCGAGFLTLPNRCHSAVVMGRR
jgi:hypothetical protein